MSFFSPSITPRVSDDPSTIIETNESNSVVKSSSTIAENTTTIELPVASINSNRNGSLSSKIFKSGTISLGNIFEGGDSVGSFLTLTSLVSSGVGISSLGSDTVFDDVLEGIVHPSTTTTVVSVASRAINEFLFRKSVQSLSTNSKRSFHSSNSREGPAGSTSSLVSDGVKDTSVSPVNTVGGRVGGYVEVQ